MKQKYIFCEKKNQNGQLKKKLFLLIVLAQNRLPLRIQIASVKERVVF
jgi:hypothetical protein